MLEITLAPDSPADLPAVAEHQPVEFACPATPGARLALAIDGLALEPFLRPGQATWRWRWNPGPAVGWRRLQLIIRAGAHDQSYEWPLRVLARKIDQERYEALIDDLQRVAFRLVAALAGAGAEGAALERAEPWQHSPAETYYAILAERLEGFARAVRRIASRPREQLRRARDQTPLGLAGELSPAAIAELGRTPLEPAPPDAAALLQEAIRPGGGALPQSVVSERALPTADIYEHRLLKQLLAQLARRARSVGRLAEREAERLAANAAMADVPAARLLRAQQIAAGCAAAGRSLRELRALPFLAEVGPLPAFQGATPLLQRDPHYREVYRMWQALRQLPQLAFDSPLFALPIAELPRLYESWCALQVAEALLSLGELRAQQLIQARPAGPDELEQLVELGERAPLLEIARGEWTLALRYQPRYRPSGAKSKEPRTTEASAGSRFSVPGSSSLGSLDRYTHVPDLAIELRRPGAPLRVLVLDAKYRLDAEGRGVPPDALADAYTYLGAIGAGGRPATLGAWLLYPGRGAPELFSSGVGAVPLLPGGDGRLAALLERALLPA